MTSRNQYRTLEVLEAYLYLKARVYLDQHRNSLFKFLDKHSKKLDNIADSKIKNFDMRQYAMFRDITEMHFYGDKPTHTEFRPPVKISKVREVTPQYEEDDYYDEEN